MGKTFTYSFEDTVVTISHPQFGTYSAYGTGIGSISVGYSNDVTSHEVSADLAVVVSKTPIKNGKISFEILQSSDFHQFLKKWASYLENASTDQFADTTITIKNNSTKDSYTCTGCSHTKVPDNAFAATAGNITWEIMAANIALN